MGFSFDKNSDNASAIPKTSLNLPTRPGSIDPKVQQVDIFPLDAFEFDNPVEVANPRVMLKSPWRWEVQSEIDALASEIGELRKLLVLSAAAFLKNRVEVVSPSTLVVSSQDSTGVAYSGRFVIYLRYTTGAVTTAYTSPSDEASHTYAVPATVNVGGTVYPVIGVLVELYAAGGTTKKLDYRECPVSLDVTATAVYHGSLSVAPAGNLIPGDFYFDNRTLALGGGVLRYWTGATWIEMTGVTPGYDESLWIAMPDMSQWSEDQDTPLTAANTIFERLFAYDAYLANIFARTITVSPGGRIRYETGSGVQKRCVQLANEKIDWIDVPDTTPPSPEQLRARIGRLGVGGSILMDGEFLANCESAWSYESSINATVSSKQKTVQLSDGTVACVYVNSTGQIVIRTSSDLTTWTSPVLIESSTDNTYPILIESNDGDIACLYRDASGTLKLKTSSDLSTWSTATNTNIPYGEDVSVIALEDGTFVMTYIELYASVKVVCTTSSDLITWSSPTIISPSQSSSSFVNIIQLFNKSFACMYRRAVSFDIVIITSNDLITWTTSPVVIEPASSYYPNLIQIIDGSVVCVYANASTGYVIMRSSYDLINWSSPVTINDAVATYPCLTQLKSGLLLVTYHNSSNYIIFRSLQRYAPLATIIPPVISPSSMTLGLDNISVLVTDAAAVTITIPAGCAIGHEIRIMRTVASANAITVARSGSELIEGATTFVTHGSWAAATLNLSEVTLKKVSATEWRFVGGEISGSNANGIWIDRPNGMRHSEYLHGSLITTSNYSSGNGYYGTLAVTFPREYYSTPIVVGFVRLYGGAQDSCQGYNTVTAGTTLFIAGLTAADRAYPGYTAEGRWRA